jgi:FG-GAP-like repeat
MATGDFNKDGWMDIIIARYDQFARVWWNIGEGSFKTGWDFLSAQAKTTP